jgi:hypothetical protein
LKKDVFPQDQAVIPQEVRLALRVAVRNDCVAVVLHIQCFVRHRISLFNFAVDSGSVQVMRNYLEMEPQLRQPVHVNFYLERACGHKFAAQCLVTYKAIVNPQYTRFPPMYDAISGGYARVVVLLLQAKASLNAKIGLYERSPLAFARAMSANDPTHKHKLVERLLERALQLQDK